MEQQTQTQTQTKEKEKQAVNARTREEAAAPTRKKPHPAESLDLLPRLCHRAVIFAFQTQNAL